MMQMAVVKSAFDVAKIPTILILMAFVLLKDSFSTLLAAYAAVRTAYTSFGTAHRTANSIINIAISPDIASHCLVQKTLKLM